MVLAASRRGVLANSKSKITVAPTTTASPISRPVVPSHFDLRDLREDFLLAFIILTAPCLEPAFQLQTPDVQHSARPFAGHIVAEMRRESSFCRCHFAWHGKWIARKTTRFVSYGVSKDGASPTVNAME